MTVQATESMSFFDPRNPIRQQSLLQTQYDPSSPSVPQLRRGTNLLVPDYRAEDRLSHFPSDLYDLRPQSHLVRFLKALLGDAGAGHVRKRYLIARLQQAMRSTHFYDLDRFYGALFGAQRLRVERLPLNPMTSLATSDEWDQIHAADTSYRERIHALAKAIPLGATVPGMKTAAEAITSVSCEVTETWRLMDYARKHGYRTKDDIVVRRWREVQAFYGSWGRMNGLTYDEIADKPVTFVLHNRSMTEVEADFPTYGDADSNAIPPTTWHDVQFRRVPVGRVRNDRTSFIVRPLKHYRTDNAYDRRERAEDEYALRRVLNVLKPTSSRLSLDAEGISLHQPIPLSSIESSSDGYEITTHVTPRISATLPDRTYPLSVGQVQAGVEKVEERLLARPPFTATEGTGWTYNNEVVSVRSYTERIDGSRIESRNYELIPNTYGEVQAYTPDRAVLDPRSSEAMRLASDGVLVAHPYSQDRVVVATHE